MTWQGLPLPRRAPTAARLARAEEQAACEPGTPNPPQPLIPHPPSSQEFASVDVRLQEHFLWLLLSRLGHDFSHYKRSHLVSAIKARVAACGQDDAYAYALLLAAGTEELQALSSLVMIQVTAFFRNPESFQSLKQHALFPALRRREAGDTFHAWCAGCSTGEEAYSVAILLKEALSEVLSPVDFWVLATDIDERAVLLAQSGLFPPSSVHRAVTLGRRDRFFHRSPEGYRAGGSIASRVSFSVEDALDSPPMNDLDLISCRNLMIYLEPEDQARLLAGFHRALRPGGILFLGPAESIGETGDLFIAVDRRWKIYTTDRAQPPAELHTGQSRSGLAHSGSEQPTAPHVSNRRLVS